MMGIVWGVVLIIVLALLIYILLHSFVIVHSGGVKVLERFGNDVEKYVYKNENSERSVVLDCQSNLRGIIGNKELNEVLNGTEVINADLFDSIKDITNGYGVAVDRINIGQLKANSEVQAAMDKLLTANRTKEATITSAEAQKESVRLEAEGQASQVEIAARAEANRIAKIAAAESNRIQTINSAVKESGLDDKMLQYLGLQEFGKLAEGPSNTVIVPSNMTDLGNIPAAKKLWEASK